jgi:hypothetical protein
MLIFFKKPHRFPLFSLPTSFDSMEREEGLDAVDEAIREAGLIGSWGCSPFRSDEETDASANTVSGTRLRSPRPAPTPRGRLSNLREERLSLSALEELNPIGSDFGALAGALGEDAVLGLRLDPDAPWSRLCKDVVILVSSSALFILRIGCLLPMLLTEL